MNLETRPPHHLAVVGLLALLPVLWYATGRSLSGGAFAAINVVIIVSALSVAMGPLATDSHDHENGTST